MTVAAFVDPARRATEARFARRAETVSVDVGGIATTVQAIRLAPSEEIRFGARDLVDETVVLRFLASEVAAGGLAASIVGDGVAITLADGEQRVAQGAPRWDDNLRLTVAVDTREAG